MIVALTSDLHLGEMCTSRTIEKMLQRMAKHAPRVVLNLGDSNGGFYGWRAANTVSKLLRKDIPDAVIAELPGNHDYWLKGVLDVDHLADRVTETNPSRQEWDAAREKLHKGYKDAGNHDLNRDGPLRVDGWTFVGHTFWYMEPNPGTNDKHWLPREWEIHQRIYSESYNALWANLDLLTPEDRNVVVCSHMPLVGSHYGFDGKVTDENTRLGEAIIEQVRPRAFFNGHAHQTWTGPLRYEAGSNQVKNRRYDKPRYLVLDLRADGVIAVLHVEI